MKVIFRLSLSLLCFIQSLVFAAESYVVVDHETGHILESRDLSSPRQVASLTKLASTLLILDWLEEQGTDPQALVVVGPDALRGGANPLGLRVGDELSYDAGLRAAMMASDNTSIAALATAVGDRLESGGGQRAFVAKMNELAVSLGLEQTHFVNPHGLDEGSTFGVSTAADMARLAMYALDRPRFLELCEEREALVRIKQGGKWIEKKLVNTNELVGSRGIDGMKTGLTRRAGPCLILTATRDLEVGSKIVNRRLLLVLLNSEDRFREGVLLLDHAWPACANWLAAGGVIDPKQCLRKRKD